MKKSEKRLLIVFGIALFIVANILGEGIFAQRKAAAEIAIENHKNSVTEFELLLRNRALMDKQRGWLSSRQPRYISEESAANDIEAHVTNGANQSGVNVDSRKPTEPVAEAHFTQVAVNVNVSGEAGAVTQFISLIQSQNGFYAIPSVNYTTDRRDPSILRCAATIARWYSNQPAASPAPAAGDNVAAAAGN